MVKLLAAYKAHLDSALIFVAAWGNEEAAELLLKYGASPNAAGRKGSTALMPAEQGGHLMIAELLLDRGTNIDAVDDEGQSVFIHAGKKGHDRAFA